MTRTLRYLLLFALTALSGSVIAQEISGNIVDEKKQPLINAIVQVYQGGILKGGNVSDYDGNYTVKPLEPGYYNVLVHYAGYDSIMITDVVVTPGQRTTQNFTMRRHAQGLKEVVIRYKRPLIDIDKGGDKVLTKEEIKEIPTTQVNDLVSTAAGVYQSQRGGDVNIGGARTSGTLYIIDGVQVQGSYGIDMAQGGVDQLEVLTSGIPANYGDVSGGVVNITTRGVAPKLTGDVRVQHSIDGYNNNLLSFSIAGPLLKKDVPGEKTKKPVLGFSLSGDFYDDHERYPDYEEQYTAKPSVLKNLQQNPLKVVTNSSGQTAYYNSSDFVTYDSLEKTRIIPHDKIQEGRLNGKLDYQLSDNMHIIAGGNFDYLKQDMYSRARDMFAPEATPVQNTLTGRGFIRFTQRFGKIGDTSTKHSVISNAYYSLQGDYQKVSQIQQDPNFKQNFFDYAYIGKFVHPGDNTGTGKTAIYLPGTDSLSGKTGVVLQGYVPNPIEFEPDPSHINQNLANYTTEFYNSLSDATRNNLNYMAQITNNGASLSNGDEPFNTYGLFYSPGATQTYFQKFNSNQYALTVDASFDLQIGKTKHAIGFGLYYQQRIERDFVVYTNTGTNSLWQEMRQLVSSVENGGLSLDKSNPIFVVNGKQYTLSQVNAGVVRPGINDTIIYNLQNLQSTAFDQNLRKKLGVNSTTDINIDNLDPSTFSLNMFSADELLNDGGYKSLVNYYGYGYDGSAQTGNVNFNDFWTQKDANGNYTRPIGAFSPNYIAGYLLDKFNYKDVHFNIGLRIDRYSANTKVLKDPYSEYGELTVSQVSGAANLYNNGQHPANIGGNYVVYVNDNNSSAPSIVGYRNGNDWYDPTGKQISDPALLKTFTNGSDAQPDIIKNSNGGYAKITDTSYNPNSAFTDYTPQVLLQPRLSFSFPISEVANFYAHYDIYQRRPTQYVVATAADYYYLQDNANLVISNANLKPEETYDYEVGFQQKLSTSSALTITAFYKERKNMITTVPYIDAFPTTYYTYGNRDFSTTKGTSLFYDLRATNHLRMTLSYTLQFAEGTGSTPTSTNANGGGQIDPNGLLQSFIEAGLPNLRYVTYLDYDSRHNIVANIDYRYNQDEGPMIGGSHVFQNMGLDLIARARSGEPYTRYSDAQGNTVIGGVNGSRLPWHYGVDLRLDKDFALNKVKKHEDVPEGAKSKRQLYLKGILQVNNLLNTRDILHVYGYTGRPNDDGYLASAVGQQFTQQQVSPLSYSQLYQIAYNNPSNLNYARTISLALEFNF